MFQIQTVLLMLGLLVLANQGFAVRQYNPQTGESEAVAPRVGGMQPVANPATSAKPDISAQPVPPLDLSTRPRFQPDPKLIQSLDALQQQTAPAQTAPKPKPYGNVYVFFAPDTFDAGVAKSINSLQKWDDYLHIELYMPMLDPREYSKITGQPGFDTLDPEWTEIASDQHGLMAKKLRVSGTQEIVFHDATGTRRTYNLKTEFPNFMRHLQRVHDAQRQKSGGSR